jgi:hypothetical protein
MDARKWTHCDDADPLRWHRTVTCLEGQKDILKTLNAQLLDTEFFYSVARSLAHVAKAA